MPRPLIYLTFCLMLSNTVSAQSEWAWWYQAHLGSIVKHTRQMDHLTFNNAIGGELSMVRQSDGTKAWQHMLNHPEIGASLMFTNFGNNKELGSAVGIFPFVDFKLIEKSKFTFNTRIGTGAAWLTKPFHIKDNTVNNAIGSGLNNLSYFELSGNWFLSEQTTLHASIMHKHYSNGAFKAPNLGFNVPSVGLGLKHYIERSVPSTKPDTVMPTGRDVQLRIRFGIALKEDAVPGGPKYPVYTVATAVTKKLSHVNRIGIGTYVAYYSPIYDYLINFELREDKNQRLEAMRWGIEISDEILLGDFGVVGQFGYYLHNKLFKVASIYNRLGILYYFAHHHMFAGLYLKSNKWTADYIDMTVGATF